MSRIAHWQNVSKWRWHTLIPQFCDGVWRWFMDDGVKVGLLREIPRVEWTPPPMPMIEPDKEGELDTLLDEYEPGMTSDRLDLIFGALRRDQVPLVRRLLEQEDAVSDAPLRAGDLATFGFTEEMIWPVRRSQPAGRPPV